MRLSVEQLGSIPMFTGIDVEVLESANHDNMLVKKKHGETLFRQGEESTGFYFVAHGGIQLTVTASSGATRTVEIINEGETFGEAVVFLDRPYPVMATAMQDSTLYFVSTTCIDTLLAVGPKVARHLLANLSMRAHQLVQDVAALTLASAVARVAEYVRHLLPNPDVPATVMLPGAKYIVASRLGLTPETFSRALRQLHEQGAIDVDGQRITIVNPVALLDTIE